MKTVLRVYSPGFNPENLNLPSKSVYTLLSDSTRETDTPARHSPVLPSVIVPDMATSEDSGHQHTTEETMRRLYHGIDARLPFIDLDGSLPAVTGHFSGLLHTNADGNQI